METHMKNVTKFAYAIGLVATLLLGSAGMTLAQPGSGFENRGERESEGLRPTRDPLLAREKAARAHHSTHHRAPVHHRKTTPDSSSR
jgi:hypothetical protein